MRSAMPSFTEHLSVIDHDKKHGQARAPLGLRAHWLKMWWIQKTRQWTSVDAVVCGSNPILGAIACAGLARSGKTVAWLSTGGFDAWDYPLAISGQHDDLMIAAGLPPMGSKWFIALSKLSEGRVWRAKGLDVSYVFQSERKGSFKIAFAVPRAPEELPLGKSRQTAEKWMEQAFMHAPQHIFKQRPMRLGGGDRQQLFATTLVVWVSDRLDGAYREQGLGAGPKQAFSVAKCGEMRLGRSRWHTQVAIDFAAQSRHDIKLALEAGGW